MNNYELGKIGEDAVKFYLEKSDCMVITMNYRTRYGEIDIIFLDGDTLVFGEVKTRRTKKYGLPIEAINSRKMERILRVSNEFLARNNIFSSKTRFDAFEVYYKEKLINHVKNIFCAG